MTTAKFHVVAIDETSDWVSNLEIWQYAEKIFGVYFFDRNRATHCCELTPSYELRFVESVVQWKPDVDLSDEEWERLRSPIEEADCEAESYKYFHCSGIESLQEARFSDTGSPRLVSVEDCEWGTEEEYKELAESCWEYVRCNSFI